MKTTTVQDASTLVTSSQFTINLRDLGRAFIAATISAVFVVIGAGVLLIIASLTPQEATFADINWNFIWKSSTVTFLSFLSVNFFDKAKVLLLNPSQTLIETVKEVKKAEDKSLEIVVKPIDTPVLPAAPNIE